MATTINASTSAGLVSTADTSGVLQLQTAGTTAVTLSAAQAATFAGVAQFPTTIGVGAATPSTSGAGITFPASENLSSNANTLDDYEEGTFTWNLLFGATTAQSGTGNYRKIGSMVMFQIFTGSMTVSGTGNMTITGLPYTSTGYQVPGIWLYGGQSLTGVIAARVVQTGTSLEITQSGTSGSYASFVTNSNIVNASSQLICTGVYYV